MGLLNKLPVAELDDGNKIIKELSRMGIYDLVLVDGEVQSYLLKTKLED